MSIHSPLRNFLKNSSGNVTMIFGLSAIPMLLAAGIAIDYGTELSAKTKLQTAVDSAALAAAADVGNGVSTYAATAKKYVAANRPDSMASKPLNVDVSLNTQNLSVTVKATGTVDTAFGGFFDWNSSQGSAETASNTTPTNQISSSSTVMLPIFSTFHKGEIVLVVDYSGSMGDPVGGVAKYISMKNQVTTLINQLSQNGTNTDVKFGIVPFSEYVRVAMPDYYFNGRSSSATQTRCIEDRGYPYNTQSTTPNTSPNTNSTKWNYFSPSNNNNCGSYNTYNVTVRPLTTDHAGTLAQFNQMRPIGNTHIALGLEMAYHMLTPNAPMTEGSPMGGSDTLKAVVLLTDGAQTSGGYGPNNTWSVPQAESNTATLCTALKTAGIRVVTVSFDLADSANAASEQRLANCASGPQYYFNTDSNAALADAFGTIKNQLARNMYISK